MTLHSRVNVVRNWRNKLVRLLSDKDTVLEEVIFQQARYNKWKLPEFSYTSLQAIPQILSDEFLDHCQELSTQENLNRNNAQLVASFLNDEDLLVEIVSVLLIFLAGHRSVVPTIFLKNPIVNFLVQNPDIPEMNFEDRIIGTDDFRQCNCMVMSSKQRSFDYHNRYFSKKATFEFPQRYSSALLTGAETETELAALFDDVIRYFGKAAGAVTRLFVPHNYDFNPLIAVFNRHAGEIATHHLYLNHLDYQKTIHIINKISYVDAGVLMMIENDAPLTSRGILHYQHYTSLEDFFVRISEVENQSAWITSAQIPVTNYRPGKSYMSLADDFVDLFAFLIEQ